MTPIVPRAVSLPEIEFNSELHEYRVGGVVMPSVTKVLSAVGLIDGRWFTPESRERGSAVHAACHYLDEGDLDFASVAPEIEPYLRGWETFKADVKAKILSLEQPVYNHTLGYCGTLDRVIEIVRSPGHKWLLDIKTGGPADWHRLQTAAYSMTFPHFPMRRATVHLGSNGRYAMREYKLSDMLTDRGDFQAALRVYNLQRRKA